MQGVLSAQRRTTEYWLYLKNSLFEEGRWNRRAFGEASFEVPSPSASLICVDSMKVAMPAVKPVVTGRGTSLTADPSPVSPMRINMPPKSIVQTTSFSGPYSWAIPDKRERVLSERETAS